jgi:hypothetical protein
MGDTDDEWRPGSFTKNFGWGVDGLGLLHRALRAGFADEEKDVPRRVFMDRLRQARLIEFIPANFFLFNRPIGGIDHIIFDELAFQAVTNPHSPRFDKLALCAFNFSYVGRWASARQHQKRPALWAFNYIRQRVAGELHWDTKNVNADDIERFVTADPRYKAKTARKLSTNLSHLYQIGRLREFGSSRVERWWVDALFLALDRLIEDRALEGQYPSENQYASLLSNSGFHEISGHRSLEKDLASNHLLSLYIACGSRDRFSPDHVRERTALKIPQLQWYIANDDRPQAAVHPSNPRVLKGIPRACAMLATYVAGFEIIDADELLEFTPEDFIKRQTSKALKLIRDNGIKPTISAEELMRITRDQ